MCGVVKRRKSGCSRINGLAVISAISTSARMQGKIKTCSEDESVKGLYRPQLASNRSDACACAVAWESPRWRLSGYSRINGYPAISTISFLVCMLGMYKTCSEDDSVQGNVSPSALKHFNRMLARPRWREKAQGGWAQIRCSRINGYQAISALSSSVRMQGKIKL